MSKNVLYVTFIDWEDLSSGSSVRPNRIYNAFLERGCNVKLITGSQNNKRKRWKTVFKAMFNGIAKGVDLCYIEPPSGPIFNLCDHILLFYLKIKKVPVGIFYRDAYWKLLDNYQLPFLKKKMITAMHLWDIFVFKRTCKVVFFPTKTMADYFNFKTMIPLPPACEKVSPKESNPITKQIIYVGSISNYYGEKMLLEAMDIVNATEDIQLTLVCREAEKGGIGEYVDRKWLKLYHLSGPELAKLYSQSDFAIVPRSRGKYTDLAMPVKVFEYIDNGLPIVATDCLEVAQFVNKYSIGTVCEDNAQALANAILHMYEDSLIENCKDNIIKCLSEGNLWVDRIDSIIEAL